MGSQFVIPVYQRKYTWNPSTETQRFMNDVENILEGITQQHFMGIVIYMNSKIAAMHREIQIVDGQQRLTTSFIFLLCLKKVAEELNETEVVGMIEDYYLYNRHTNDAIKLRLKPAVAEDDVYAKLVYGSSLDLTRSEKESCVYRNFEYIYRRIKEFTKTYSLLEILDTLSKLDILAFPLSKHDNAQQIFESINSSGAPLTSADLIRNYILMNDTSEVQERYYTMYWQPLEKRFKEPRRLEEFFRFYLAAKTCSLASRKDVYEEFKKYWKKSTQSRETLLREVNRYCRYYYNLYYGPTDDAKLESVLKEVRLNESRMPAPFLMEMYRLYEEEQIDLDTFVNQLRLIDTYLTRRSLCGMESSTLTRYFPQLLRSIMNSWEKSNRNIHEITKVFLINFNRGKALAMPTDEQLRTSLKEINAYTLMSIRQVLERIEHLGATAKVDTDNLNIEHIMPQHPNSWWKEHSHAKSNEEYLRHANLIGNLTLCAEYDNVRMGNEDFNFKKEVLSKTLHIRMNTEILKQETWTIEDILDRCERLTDRIIEIYPYKDGVENAVVESGADVIVMNTPSVNARAIYHGANAIEILSGTTMKAYGPQEMKALRETYRDMVENGVIYEDASGQMLFDKNHTFNDLNIAARFLLHRGGDNTRAWLCENGEVFVDAKKDLVKAEVAKLQAVKEKTTEKKKEVVKVDKKKSKDVKPVVSNSKKQTKAHREEPSKVVKKQRQPKKVKQVEPKKKEKAVQVVKPTKKKKQVVSKQKKQTPSKKKEKVIETTKKVQQPKKKDVTKSKKSVKKQSKKEKSEPSKGKKASTKKPSKKQPAKKPDVKQPTKKRQSKKETAKKKTGSQKVKKETRMEEKKNTNNQANTNKPTNNQKKKSNNKSKYRKFRQAGQGNEPLKPQAGANKPTEEAKGNIFLRHLENFGNN